MTVQDLLRKAEQEAQKSRRVVIKESPDAEAFRSFMQDIRNTSRAVREGLEKEPPKK